MPNETPGDDVQGIVFQGYGHLEFARFVLLRIESADRARAWLRRAADALTYGAKQPADRAMNVGFTRDGLVALGLDELDGFDPAFCEGMAGDVRSQVLGDRGDSEPGRWWWGGASGPGRPHAVLMLYAKDVTSLCSTMETLDEASGMEVLRAIPTQALGPGSAREHFGFEDGISQPWFRGVLATGEEADRVEPGEFVLGYPDQSKATKLGPLVKNNRDAASRAGLRPAPNSSEGFILGRDGSYLVIRQFDQKVIDFWRWLDNQGPAQALELRAAKLMGRWPSGKPLTKGCYADLSPQQVSNANDFTFGDDKAGHVCPLGAHIRRANPRDTILEPFDENEPEKDRQREANKHRILRRGRPYGPPVAGWPNPHEMLARATSPENGERGLLFICLNADITNQFEFVHRAWLNNPHFGGVGASEVDPVVGDQSQGGGSFTVQGEIRLRLGAGQLPSLQRFVTVRGGDYFFLPGRAALKYLAMMK